MLFRSRLDVISIGLVGSTGTGKSTLAETIAHLIHTISHEDKWINWQYRVLDQEDFLDFENTVRKLPVANYILYFHDLSFLGDSKKMNKVKQISTQIRHLKEGVDVQMVFIYDYHYTKALDKFLRQTDFKFFTSIGESEGENVQDMIGYKNKRVIAQFRKQHHHSISTGKYTYILAKAGTFSYEYRKPFAIGLFWNQERVRHVIYPKRTWLDPVCMFCNPDDKTESNGNEMEAFHNKHPSQARSILRQILRSQGYDTFSKGYVMAYNHAMKLNKEGKIKPKDVIDFYDLQLR